LPTKRGTPSDIPVFVVIALFVITRRALLTIAGASPLLRSSTNSISVRDLGAIGDGGSHPVREWIGSRFRDLASIQAEYPDVRTLDDEIDFAAMNKAIRLAGVVGCRVVLPPGVFRGWIYVRANGVSLVGAGARLTRIRLPDGAWHQSPREGRSDLVEGTPCVIEAGEIGRGNFATRYVGLRLEGVTLDGNRLRTARPRDTKEDIFGWGLAFTNMVQVRYRDIRVVDCHAGGVGTFINANDHEGACIIERCGFALGHPGFDVNSSQDGRWSVIARDCCYGVRLLDNVWRSALIARVQNAVRTGFVYDNQLANSSYSNIIRLLAQGGCRDAGALIGANCSDSHLALTVNDIEGFGVHGLPSTNPSRRRAPNTFTVRTLRSGSSGCLIEGDGDAWAIRSRFDGRAGAPGSAFAVDITGSSNRLVLDIEDQAPARVRGLALRSGASHNTVTRYRHMGLVQPLMNLGENNDIAN